nr:zinc finger protein 638-like [Zonotrichia albicollis]
MWLEEGEAGMFVGAVCGDCGVSSALDILVPKAGFFCQICSLFYADEPSMINHCRTPLHRQNMEKFMAKQQESGGEEPSSR